MKKMEYGKPFGMPSWEHYKIYIPNFLSTSIWNINNTPITARFCSPYAIAISSLILKLLDWIILLLESDKLSVDQLSFGYQKCTSTVMCSFSMTNVIEHYNNKGQEVYGFSGDISKGFDVLDWLPLFTELIKRKISKICLRVMIYSNQSKIFQSK